MHQLILGKTLALQKPHTLKLLLQKQPPPLARLDTNSGLDTVFFLDTILAMARLWTAFAAICLLLYGLVFEEE